MLPRYSPGTSTSKPPLMQSEGSAFDLDLEAQLGPNGELIEVEYMFIPRWPMSGPPEFVISVIGKTKQATTSIVKKSFPALFEIPVDDIEFLALLSDGATMGVVTAEVWKRFRKTPPLSLQVQIRDSPTGASQRMTHFERKSERYAFLMKVVPPICHTFIVVSAVIGVLLLWKWLFLSSCATTITEAKTAFASASQGANGTVQG